MEALIMRILFTPHNLNKYQANKHYTGAIARPSQPDTVSFGKFGDKESIAMIHGVYCSSEPVNLKSLDIYYPKDHQTGYASRVVLKKGGVIDELLRCKELNASGQLTVGTLVSNIAEVDDLTAKKIEIDYVFQSSGNVVADEFRNNGTVTRLNNATIANLYAGGDSLTVSGQLNSSDSVTVKGIARLNNANLNRLTVEDKLFSDGLIDANKVIVHSDAILNEAKLDELLVGAKLSSSKSLIATNAYIRGSVSLKDSKIGTLIAGDDLLSGGKMNAKSIIAMNNVQFNEVGEIGNIAFMESQNAAKNKVRVLQIEDLASLADKKINILLGNIAELVIKTREGSADVLKHFNIFDAYFSETLNELGAFDSVATQYDNFKGVVIQKAQAAFTPAEIEKFIKCGIIKIQKIV